MCILRRLGLHVVAEQQNPLAGATAQRFDPALDPFAQFIIGIAVVELPGRLARMPAPGVAAVKADAEKLRVGDGFPDRKHVRQGRTVDDHQRCPALFKFVQHTVRGPGTVAELDRQGQSLERVEKGGQVSAMNRGAVESRRELNQNNHQLAGLNQGREAVPVRQGQVGPALEVDFMCQGARQPGGEQEIRRNLPTAPFHRLGSGKLIGCGVEFGYGKAAGIQRQHPVRCGAGGVKPGRDPFGVGIAAGANVQTTWWRRNMG